MRNGELNMYVVERGPTGKPWEWLEVRISCARPVPLANAIGGLKHEKELHMNRIPLIALLLSVISVPLMWASESEREILTPKPPAGARVNGPTIYGTHPGHEFLYRIPCTGKRPIQFAAPGLPASLHLDAATGIITGRSPDKPGTYAVTLQASNAIGKSSRLFRIVVGNTLALTPPMGWNSWYSYYEQVTDRVVREAAGDMISSGMADFGYQFINVDGGWQVNTNGKDPEVGGESRDAKGNINSNRRFPDMQAMAAYIHAKGLKAGLYTSPGPVDCAESTGRYQHEAADAKTFAAWGFDFLKYDWCSYTEIAPAKPSLADMRKPYDLMGEILKKQDRDIVFNMCQYGMGDVWTWGADAGGNAWRTTGDLGHGQGRSAAGVHTIGLANAALSSYAGPGHWNDPDYLLIGNVGDAFKWDQSPPRKPTSLTPDEQYSYVSMWSLMVAPLFFAGDMTALDDFTLGLLCNSEVIDVDQDALGVAGARHPAEHLTS